MASFAESVHWMKKETTVVKESKEPVPSSQESSSIIRRSNKTFLG
jgi:hypothetical protein